MDNRILAPDVQSRIYRIRGQRVMLSPELASLYHVPAKALIQSVKRNVERFPSDFMFQLSAQEWQNLKSQIVTSSWGGIRRAVPYAFTELGIAMLSSILRSREAIQVNIAIMRAFVKLRRALSASQEIARRVEKLEGKVNMHDTDIGMLVQAVIELRKRPSAIGPIDPEVL